MLIEGKVIWGEFGTRSVTLSFAESASFRRVRQGPEPSREHLAASPIETPKPRRGQFEQVAVRIPKIEAARSSFPNDLTQHLDPVTL